MEVATPGRADDQPNPASASVDDFIDFEREPDRAESEGAYGVEDDGGDVYDDDDDDDDDDDPHAHRPHDVPPVREPRADFPPSYAVNSKKELAALDFAENFMRQFRQLYNNRKPMYLSPPNECGVPKLVCTTVRATQLPFRELYSHEETSRFVSSFLTYDFLRTTDPPEVLQSPATTLHNQRGNCFDYAVLLCSLLEGAGYDAYVVHGYATREVCLLDRSRRELPVETTNPEVPEPAKEVKVAPNKYRIAPSFSLESKYERDMRERAERAKADKAAAERADAERAAADSQRPVADELHGLRTHSWVLVLRGKRGVPEDFFIEPSTGETVSVRSEDYLGVESVWNSKNFWVNMQDCTEGVLDMAYDMSDTSKWEYLFPELPSAPRRPSRGVEPPPADLPPSWVEELVVHPADFAAGRPHGEREIVSRNARTNEFAPYTRDDGMVAQTTYYSDYELTQEVLRVDVFENRADRLQRLEVRELEDRDRYDEVFARGRSSGLRHHTYYKGHWAGGGADKDRTMYFFPDARVDGLYRRVQAAGRFEETFRGREDKLLTRVVQFAGAGPALGSAGPTRRRSHSVSNAPSKPKPAGSDKGGDGTQIEHITETFARNPAVPADKDIAEITYYEDAIVVTYHRADDRATAQFREFEKPAKTDRGTYLPLSATDGEGVLQYHPDPNEVVRENFAVNKLFAELLGMEREARAAVAASQDEIARITRQRRDDEMDIKLSISFYDTIHQAEAKAKRLEQEAAAARLAKEQSERERDYLAPFIQRLVEPKELLPGMEQHVDKVKASNWRTADGEFSEDLLTMFAVELNLFMEKVNFSEKDKGDLLERREERRKKAIAESCLADFFERATAKEQRIIANIETEKRNLADKQRWYQENQATLEASEEKDYVDFCQDSLDRLKVLERRLTEHRKQRNHDEAALKSRLRADPRLEGWLPAV